MENYQKTEATADTSRAYKEARRELVRRKEKKAKTFAEHLSKVFKPNPREITQEEKNS